MPITDRAKLAVLSSLTAGTWTDLGAVVVPVVDGFDTCDVTWVCDFKATVKTGAQIAALSNFAQGTQYGSTDFWLRTIAPQRMGGNVWMVKAHYEGRVSSSKPRHVKMLSNTEVFNIASLTMAGLFTDAPVNVRECSPSVEIGYVLVGSEPPTASVGLVGSPSVAPSVRSGYWGDLTDPRFNFPAGWLFADVDGDRLDGAVVSDHGVYYVRETWQYLQSKIPA